MEPQNHVVAKGIHHLDRESILVLIVACLTTIYVLVDFWFYFKKRDPLRPLIVVLVDSIFFLLWATSVIAFGVLHGGALLTSCGGLEVGSYSTYINGVYTVRDEYLVTPDRCEFLKVGFTLMTFEVYVFSFSLLVDLGLLGVSVWGFLFARFC